MNLPLSKIKYVRNIVTFLIAAITIWLGLFFNGNVKVPGVPLPALAKFLHPVNGVWANGEKSNFEDEIIKTTSLTNKAEVIYDERMIPHIFAENTTDALFMQGYVEASQRLFQMEIMTRAATGRMSEIFGILTINLDKKQNRSQIEYAADNAVSGWANFPNEIKLLQSYVDGVNAYINSLKPKDYPYEYKLLNFAPEPWTIKKSALVYLSMADILAGASEDMESSNSLSVLGRELFDAIYPEQEDGNYPVIPYEKKYNFKNEYSSNPKDSIISKKYYKYFYKNRDKGVGSNNWAIGKIKSKSGNAILCNDPHLALNIPSIWIEEHISTPDYNAYGVSFPGFPGIMIGFNDHIAWGETNVGHDIEDIFEVKWANPHRTKYILDGKEVATKVIYKEIKIKGLESKTDTLYYTDKGIVKFLSKDGKSDLAVRWLAADQADKPEFMTFIKVMESKNYEEYKKAINYFNIPAQNFLYADKQGNIGLHVNGKFPIRQAEDGRFVEDGSKSSTNWDRFIDRSQNPEILNPKQGYLTSSNQRSAGKDYPYYYTGKFEHARNRVINDSLSRWQNIDITKLMQLQGNNFSIFAKEALPPILNSLSEKYGSHELYKKLAAWNYSYDEKSSAPLVYKDLFREIYNNTFDEIIRYSDTLDILWPEDWVMVDLLKNKQTSSLFDMTGTSKNETMKDLIISSFEKISSSKDAKDYTLTWGEKRPVNIDHYTQIPALSVKDISTSGFPDCINAMNKSFGPSWRMAVELGDKTTAYGIYPGGQSGNPLSKFYKNNIEKWAKNEYYSLSNEKDVSKIKVIKKITANKI